MVSSGSMIFLFAGGFLFDFLLPISSLQLNNSTLKTGFVRTERELILVCITTISQSSLVD